MFFKQLFDLAKRAGGSVTMTVAAAAEEGQMTVVVAPKAGAGNVDPALATPLVLTAAPEEFDSGFLDALSRYDAAHKSLAEQADATAEVLAAAKEAQAKKGAGAARTATPAKATPAKATPTAVASGEDADDDGGDTDDDTPEAQAGATGAVTGNATGGEAPSLFG